MKNKRNISSIELGELEEIWFGIGGTAHLSNEHQLRKWLIEGEVPEGLIFGGYEIATIGKYLFDRDFEGNFSLPVLG